MQIIEGVQAQKKMEPQHSQDVHRLDKFPIFLVVRTAQSSYGIKNGDYARYRKYCSRKVLKLRRAIGLKLSAKNKFLKKDLLRQKLDCSKMLQIFLFNAEQCWAASNQTKFSQQRKASQKSRGKFFTIKKLKRAIRWSERLKLKCREYTEGASKIEAQAYYLQLKGQLQVQTHKWNQAQSSLLACRQILNDLVHTSDSLSQGVFIDRIDQLEQTIKFCSFKASKGRELSLPQIIEMQRDSAFTDLVEGVTTSRLNDISLDKEEIRFGNERYPLKQPLIGQQKVRLDEQLRRVEQVKASWLDSPSNEQFYEGMLLLFSVAGVAAEDCIKVTEAEKDKCKDKYTQGEIEILKKISLNFQEQRINILIDRNLTIFRHDYSGQFGRRSTPQTLSKLLTATSTLLQELGEVLQQKVAVSHSNEIGNGRVQQRQFYLRTVRLFFVAQVYLNNEKVKEAYSLWCECERCLRTLNQQEGSETDSFFQLVPIPKLMQDVMICKLRCLVQKEGNVLPMQQLTQHVTHLTLQDKSLQTLIKNKDCSTPLEILANITIIDPPKVAPIPLRPIFFDIYQTNINYPIIQSKNTKTSWWNKLFK